jgi:hypothetical protein
MNGKEPSFLFLTDLYIFKMWQKTLDKNSLIFYKFSNIKNKN